MPERPYTLLSCGMSIDGYIDGATGERLLLSNAADFDRVDAVRASCDAILVGAETVRIDNPRLLVRSQARRDERATGDAGRRHELPLHDSPRNDRGDQRGRRTAADHRRVGALERADADVGAQAT